ncbi:hypothetical protein Taro_043648 [Colocasia esculenta]|uniref:DNA polymerase eta n=1 Tax=Colocasia esculenta TaxID=4460 RepID=A0A843WRY2_COLES|nr:hypothetical protein [Colocasia esculenta]
MPIARPEPQNARVIAHVDMDCFYVQVEQRKQPELRGLPTAVVQYNSWKGGGLIAVSYEARKYGVKRSMRGDEAKNVCPTIQLVQVPVSRGKADLNVYRDAGSERVFPLSSYLDFPRVGPDNLQVTYLHFQIEEGLTWAAKPTLPGVIFILATKGRCERASIDEVYLDLTDAAEQMLSETPPEKLEAIDEEALRSHVLGFSEDFEVANCCSSSSVEDSRGQEEHVRQWLCRSDADHQDKLLACGAIIVAQLRMEVLKETMFTCSAGISHNKMLAKLASGMHKPAQQTIVPSSSVKELLASFPIKKMKQLGGKLGTSLQCDLGVSTVGDLLRFTEEKLQEHYGIRTGTWLWNIARGINGDEVQGRLLPKSHGCGKTFPGPQALRTITSVRFATLNFNVEHWLNELCEELSERIQHDLEKNRRVAHTLTLHARAFKVDGLHTNKKFPSKSCPLRYGTAKIQEDARKLFDFGLREYLSLQNTGWGVTSIAISASKILAVPSGTSSILKFFNGSCPSSTFSKELTDVSAEDHLSKETADASVEDSLSFSTSASVVSSLVREHGANSGILTLESFSMWMQEFLQLVLHGKHSIMDFFRGSNSFCSSSQVCDGNEIYPGANGTESEKQLNYKGDGYQSSHIDIQQSATWRFNVDDVDASVVDELPPEIQQEIREWLHSSKHANTVKRGSTIDRYFSPVKRS